MTSLPACLRYSLGPACDTNGSVCCTSLMFDISISTSICRCIDMYKITLIYSVYESLWIEGSRLQRDLFTHVVLGSENVMFTMDIINGYQWVISLSLLLPMTKDAVQAVSTLRHAWPKIFHRRLVDVFGEGSSRTDAVAVLTPFALLDPSGMQYNWEHCDTWTDTIFMNLHRTCSGTLLHLSFSHWFHLNPTVSFALLHFQGFI